MQPIHSPSPIINDTILNNTQRSRQSAHVPPGTPELLETWLKQCAGRIRAYLSPQTTSLNVAKFDDSGSVELLDDLPDTSSVSPLTALMLDEEMRERQTHRSQIHSVLTAALETLDAQTRTLLDLY